ncbi:hypothetical protein J2X76_006009 [Neorhizobium sp. 2083]|uniref:DUF6894 family protein n=1 Tax=Neorhizobium sp. 2083 TaxID=2817762 RepID=UPI00285C07DC|nr:hypothetical protein [Neorhizobium sp. 2083]MDR6820809.1 hypothetical protein [Neorhizobium sp. 2083]
MPRFYFDVTSGGSTERDDVGLDLPSADAVRSYTAKVVAEIAREELADETTATFTVSVRDDTNFVIFSGELTYRAEWDD